ncbi:hypothetical protein BH23GEM7_BH23GEM7_08290 [soil metagenome]|nr:hypothetical protein [Gemmatimonadota bacterium]
MSRYEIEFHLDLPLAESLAACSAAVHHLGWRVVQRYAAGLICEEVQHSVFSFGSPVRAEIRAVSLVSSQTHVAIAGSNLNIGLFQSRHAKAQVEALAREIAQGVSTGATPGTESESMSQRTVIINGVQLSDAEVQAIEQRYRVRLQDGSYWYDRRSGAWGYRGGPTLGVAPAGLDLGGPLAADASNGNTGVFVNGRRLHLQEVLQLQQLLPMVLPGRYWLDAAGNFGYEGGFLLGNVWAIAALRGGPREGILSSYDKTGIAIIGGDVLIK